jgi:hypothetical protein
MAKELVLQYSNGDSVYGVFCDEHLAREARHFRTFTTRETADECKWCKQAREWDEAQNNAIPKMREALTSPNLSHTRNRSGFVHAYHRDDTSPSGVLLAASLEEQRYEKLAAELRGQVFAGSLSPLSPTEGR